MKLRTIITWEAIEDGMPIPRWLFPLYRDWDRRYIICYPVWIWPFAVVIYIAHRVIRHLAYDVHDLLNEFELLDRARKRK
jgi:hypothetical protein